LRLPSKDQILRFLQIESWDFKAGSSHDKYFKRLPNGELLRTQVPRGSEEWPADPDLWVTIRNHQLRVSEEEFWAAVKDGVPPIREGDLPSPELNFVPDWVVRNLRFTVGMREDEIAALSPDEMIAVWEEYTRRPE
jgi:hypothetical protein